jgi:hypothetical protein
MRHNRRNDADFAGPFYSKAWLFAQELLGNPIPDPQVAARKETEERAKLAWLATISPRHAEELRRLENQDAEARRKRESLIWAAGICDNAAAKLRIVLREEAEAGQADLSSSEALPESQLLSEWDPGQPRVPAGTPDGGRWLSSGGGAGGAARSSSEASRRYFGTAAQVAPDPSNPSHWYLPADAKGEWTGAKGVSAFRLKKPIKVDGKLIHEIQFTQGLPILDTYALPGKTATIILTGDHKTDIRHAEQAWRKLNPGKVLPKDATFHHDLLHATQYTVTVDGKKTKVLVGKMQLVPKEINKAVFHEGSASVAKKFYDGLGIDLDSVSRLAKKEAFLAGGPGTIVARALPKIKGGKVAKVLAPLVGRGIVRAIPIIGSGLAIVEFSENVEAHGIGGAFARATPVLGDLISATDLGSELAKEIRDQADASAGKTLRELNEPSRKAWEQADMQTIATYHELASQIEVTNTPQSDGGQGLVDPNEIAGALHEYRQAMQNANFRRNSGLRGFDFEAAAVHNKQQLRRRLERASQKRGPVPRGPMA